MEAEIIVVGAVVLLVTIALTRKLGNKSAPRTYEKPLSPISRPKPPSRSQSFDATTASPTAEPRVIEGSAYIVDGDTIKLNKTQIRLFGVDAPEMNHPYGKNAKWALVSLCKGQKVKAEIMAEDDHGRTVARCSLEDGRDLSAEMVKLGLAIDWPKYSDGEYQSLEVPGVRKKLWLANARQKGHMHLWEKFEAEQKARSSAD